MTFPANWCTSLGPTCSKWYSQGPSNKTTQHKTNVTSMSHSDHLVPLFFWRVYVLASDCFTQTCELHFIHWKALEDKLVDSGERPFLCKVPKKGLWGDAWSTEFTHPHSVNLLAHVQGSSESMGHHDIRCLGSSG